MIKCVSGSPGALSSKEFTAWDERMRKIPEESDVSTTPVGCSRTDRVVVWPQSTEVDDRTERLRLYFYFTPTEWVFSNSALYLNTP